MAVFCVLEVTPSKMDAACDVDSEIPMYHSDKRYYVQFVGTIAVAPLES